MSDRKEIDPRDILAFDGSEDLVMRRFKVTAVEGGTIMVPDTLVVARAAIEAILKTHDITTKEGEE